MMRELPKVEMEIESRPAMMGGISIKNVSDPMSEVRTPAFLSLKINDPRLRRKSNPCGSQDEYTGSD